MTAAKGRGAPAGEPTARPPLPAPVRSAEDFRRAFSVSRETADRIAAYVDLLKRWQKAINLIAPTTVADVWHRHVADSAQLLPLAPADALRWVDLGSGGGFPGMVLAILLTERTGARMTLVESDTRKSAFLREAARMTAAPVDILCMRIENATTQRKLESVDVVTARALAPLDRLLELSRPLFRPGTLGLFPKGRGVEEELRSASSRWALDAEVVTSRTDSGGRIVVIRDLES